MTKNGKTALTAIAVFLLVGAATAGGIGISKAIQDNRMPWQTSSVSEPGGGGGGTPGSSAKPSTTSSTETPVDSVTFETETITF